MAKKKVLILRQGKARKGDRRKSNFFLTTDENLMPKTRAAVARAGLKVATMKDVPDPLIDATYANRHDAEEAALKEGYKVVTYQSLRNGDNDAAQATA